MVGANREKEKVLKKKKTEEDLKEWSPLSTSNATAMKR